ncbi:MAG: VWA domain-containing protein, partial [Schwartzia sp.]|nr:VWA domain-containing protein [Schwartzia sp. (in: firmicutes)]
ETPAPKETETESHEGNQEEQPKDESMTNPNTSSGDRVDAADMRVKLPPVWIEPTKGRQKKTGSGKRSATRTDERQGRYVRAELPRTKTADIAFDATLRAAAPYQKWREKNGLALAIRSEDIRSKVREKRTGNIFLFAVDASGSMGARERMKTVKGVILKILLEAYQKRDRVGMIAFRKNQAEVLLPVTKSVDFAQKKLATMPTGGKTPLAKGLSKAEDVLDMIYRQDPMQDPVLIVITDGRATTPLAPGGDATAEAMNEAERIAKRKLPAAVIDTENGFVKLGLAKKLAQKMDASYFRVDKLSEDSLLRVWRRMSA